VAASRATALGHGLLGHAVPGQREHPQRRVRLLVGLGVERRLVLQHVARLDRGHHGDGRVGEAFRAQRRHDELRRQHRVPVPARRPQGLGDDRPAAAGVLPGDAGQRRDRQPVGVGQRHPGQAQQRPGVVAQPAGSVRAERVGHPGGQPRLEPRADQQPDHLVGRLRGQERGEQPLGPLLAHARQLQQLRGGHVVGRRDAGAGQLRRRPLAEAGPQARRAEGGEDGVGAGADGCRAHRSDRRSG
jgi:hypothetical protein